MSAFLRYYVRYVTETNRDFDQELRELVDKHFSKMGHGFLETECFLVPVNPLRI